MEYFQIIGQIMDYQNKLELPKNLSEKLFLDYMFILNGFEFFDEEEKSKHLKTVRNFLTDANVSQETYQSLIQILENASPQNQLN